jgi:transcriptional regulator with XRE-family HTH domain
VGKRIAEARTAAGLTQAALGKAVGCHLTTIQRWETCENEPALEDLESVALHTGRAVAWLAFGEDDAVGESVAGGRTGLGERVRQRRTALGLSHFQLAQMIGTASPKAIAAIESGAVQRPRSLDDLARALGVSPTWLLQGNGEQSVEQRIEALQTQNALLLQMMASLLDRFDRVFRCDKAG